MTRFDWYFDFISPFSYLQSELLPGLPMDVDMHFRPLLFAGLLRQFDNKGSAEIAPKRAWTFAHIAWLAHRLPANRN